MKPGLLTKLAAFLGARPDQGERPRWATLGLYAAGGYLLYTGNVGMATTLFGVAKGTQTAEDIARDYLRTRAAEAQAGK